MFIKLAGVAVVMETRGITATSAVDGGGTDHPSVEIRALLRATNPVSSTSSKVLIRGVENSGINRGANTDAAVRLRLDVLTSQKRTLNVSLRDLASLHEKTSQERDALREALREAETSKEVSQCGTESLRNALVKVEEEAKIAAAQASNAATQIAQAVVIAEEADARAEVAVAEVEKLKAQLELVELEKESALEKKRDSKNKTRQNSSSDATTSSQNESDTVQMIRLEQVREQHVAALKVGELERTVVRWKNAAGDASAKKKLAENELVEISGANEKLSRDLERAKAQVAALKGELEELDDALPKKETLSDAQRAELNDAQVVFLELQKMRKVATELARNVTEAKQSPQTLLDVPTAPPTARDDTPVGKVPYWYDESTDEIKLL